MRGLPHIAENFKIEIFEARFFLRLLQLHYADPKTGHQNRATGWYDWASLAS